MYKFIIADTYDSKANAFQSKQVHVRDKCHVIPFICGNLKNDTNKRNHKTEIDSQMEKINLRLPKGKAGEE